MQKIRKAVILAAGFGTRMLPATKAIPKEMLTIVDKPSIQYIVEEIAASGVHDILIILSRGKSVIEDHFDRAPELEEVLFKKNRHEELETIKNISNLANISFIRQQEMKGTGNALLYAKSFIGDEPFLVSYADDIIMGEVPASRQIIDAYEKHGKGAVSIKEVPEELVMMYSSMKTTHISENHYLIDDMIEKPKKSEIFSNFSILGRIVLPPEIFGILETTKAGAGNEIQLTDAMKTLARDKGMIGVDFIGTRYDMGNRLGSLKAIVETGLSNKEIGEEFRAYLKTILD